MLYLLSMTSSICRGIPCLGRDIPMVYSTGGILSRKRLGWLVVLILASEIWITDCLRMVSLLLLMSVHWRDVGGRLVTGWLGCSGLLAMANEVL